MEASLARPDQLKAAMEGIDILFHVAAVYSYTEPGREQEIIDASLKGIKNAFYAAYEAKVKKIVLTSSTVTLPMTIPGARPSDENDTTLLTHPSNSCICIYNAFKLRPILN